MSQTSCDTTPDAEEAQIISGVGEDSHLGVRKAVWVWRGDFGAVRRGPAVLEFLQKIPKIRPFLLAGEGGFFGRFDLFSRSFAGCPAAVTGRIASVADVDGTIALSWNVLLVLCGVLRPISIQVCTVGMRAVYGCSVVCRLVVWRSGL